MEPSTSSTANAYVETEASPRFRELKRRHRSFVLPVAVLFLLWYFAYVILADYAGEIDDLYSVPVNTSTTSLT